jgi:ApbE superfamily uncharacterized protein (UPF0280 family)
MSAMAALLPDGRLHLQHGPIDCLCRTWGEPGEVRAAYAQAAAFFVGVLDDLCAELPLLRSALPAPRPVGAVAAVMHAACLPFAGGFITPMAAVAGAVADAVLAAMVAGRGVTRAFVNNGGDIAFHLTPGTSLRCGLVTDLGGVVRDPLESDGKNGSAGRHSPTIMAGHSPTIMTGRSPPVMAGHTTPVMAGRVPAIFAPADEARMAGTRPAMTGGERPVMMHFANPRPDGTFLLTADQPARGLATSGRACKGRGGRSFSFGIADSVSILARTAAQADAAATIVGNAVDLPGHAAIDRRPASEIDPASDLGDRLVTFDLGKLDDGAIETALDAGETMADTLLRDGLIEGAVLTLRGHLRIRHPSLKLLEPA